MTETLALALPGALGTVALALHIYRLHIRTLRRRRILVRLSESAPGRDTRNNIRETLERTAGVLNLTP